MASLSITEVEKLGVTLVDGLPIAAPQLPGVADKALPIGPASTPSDAFSDRTRYVMINTDVACCLAWSVPGDPDPEAVDAIQRMPANDTRFVAVTPGGKLAVILSSVP